ncbi:flagellar filament capping protein FliD [Thermosulfurimonas sp. F29]|uniref:flagellar filament capping protein FliD n=1 Tax=Thermosulfurimonas sp. F29 TaxID=2867247 RepID=UPI001C82CDF8|nr:flagellar filament capping protein FliD [Thermosulfurimonas sp. F29]MBX6422747.1 flagellar filament capping protein FliD [Thermosulfurimonas sp. F29]
MAGEIYLSNLTGAFDAAGMVQKIMQLKSKPLEALAQKEKLLQAKKKALDELKSTVDSLQSFFEGAGIEELFQAKSGSSSDPDVVSISVDQTAPDISFDVTVSQLAQKEIRLTTGGVTDLNTVLSPATFTLRYNLNGTSYEETTINFGGGTLEDLVNAINSAQSRVEASVYFDGSTYKLLLSEADEGASTVETDTVGGTYAIEISSGSLPTELGTLDTAVLQEARNAQLQIGTGSPVYSPTNTFQDIVSGVDLTAQTTGSAHISITEDYSKVSTFLNNFASNYNKIIDKIRELTDLKTGIFLGENFVNSLESTLSGLLQPLIDKGLINFDDTGHISINSDTLDQLLQENPQEVETTLSRFKEAYSNYLSVETDYLQSLSTQYEDQINDIEEESRRIQERLAREEVRLREEYGKLEIFMNKAQETIKRLQDYIVTLSEMYGGKK